VFPSAAGRLVGLPRLRRADRRPRPPTRARLPNRTATRTGVSAWPPKVTTGTRRFCDEQDLITSGALSICSSMPPEC
jgi:hypothetical protein